MSDTTENHRYNKPLVIYHDWKKLSCDIAGLREQYPTEGEGLSDRDFAIDAYENGVAEPLIVDVSY